jgi:hypothetical protein
MTRITITVDVEGEHADPTHLVGITNDAYEQLTSYPAPLSWLGEIVEVKRTDDG